MQNVEIFVPRGFFFHMAEVCAELGHIVALKNSIAKIEKEFGASLSESEKDQLNALKMAHREGALSEKMHGKGALLNIEHPDIKFCIENGFIGPELIDNAKRYRR